MKYKCTDEDISHLRSLPVERLPRIACVIPSFNQGKFLKQTLDSVFKQNYPALEVYVADGGSKDGSVDILNEYSNRFSGIMRFDSAPDGGHIGGLTKAIGATTNEIIAWINSDDIYEPYTFWKIAAFFYFNRCALVVFGGSQYVKENLEKICDYPVRWSPKQREFQRLMKHMCGIAQPSLFFKREALNLCGYPRSKSAIDYELWLQWINDIPFYYYDDLLSKAVVHLDAVSANANTEMLVKICKEVHKHYNIVPVSWCYLVAHNKAYGAAWAKGIEAPMTRQIKIDTAVLFCYLNLCWLPGMILRQAKQFVNWMSDAIWGRA